MPRSKVEANGRPRVRHHRRVPSTSVGARAGTAHSSRCKAAPSALRSDGCERCDRALRRGGRCSGSLPLSEIVTRGGPTSGPQDHYVTALVDAIIDGAEEKLGTDTVVLDLREFVDSFDALVISAGRNDRQVRAIAEEIERRVHLAVGVKPTRLEGWDTAEWIALDYGDVIVHVFDLETRDYYDLEHLWSAAPVFRPTPRR